MKYRRKELKEKDLKKPPSKKKVKRKVAPPQRRGIEAMAFEALEGLEVLSFSLLDESETSPALQRLADVVEDLSSDLRNEIQMVWE